MNNRKGVTMQRDYLSEWAKSRAAMQQKPWYKETLNWALIAFFAFVMLVAGLLLNAIANPTPNPFYDIPIPERNEAFHNDPEITLNLAAVIPGGDEVLEPASVPGDDDGMAEYVKATHSAMQAQSEIPIRRFPVVRTSRWKRGSRLFARVRCDGRDRECVRSSRSSREVSHRKSRRTKPLE